MAKFKIKLGEKLPDFKKKVEIILANGETAEIEFTFKHLLMSELNDIINDQGKGTPESIMEFTSAWDLEDDFTLANLKELLDLYPNAAYATLNAYMSALAGVKAKN